MIPVELSTPLYTISEAASILGVSSSTLANWARGYDFTTPHGRHITAGPLVTDTGRANHQTPTVPFVGLAEAAFLAAVRRTGVPMQRIRLAIEVLRDELGVEHALASERLYTDGAEILYNHPEPGGSDTKALANLVVVRSGQGVFTDVVRDFLKNVRFGPSGYAEAIQLQRYGPANVQVNPTIAFGLPHLEANGVRVEAVLDRFHAGESVNVIAEDFNTPRDTVEQLIRARLQIAA